MVDNMPTNEKTYLALKGVCDLLPGFLKFNPLVGISTNHSENIGITRYLLKSEK